jgi:hypothetical protein
VFILDTNEIANHKIKREGAKDSNLTHCEPWGSMRARNGHQVPEARISAGEWKLSRGGRARTSPAQTGIEWISDMQNGRGSGGQRQSSGSQSWRSGELGGGYRGSSEVTLSGQVARR